MEKVCVNAFKDIILLLLILTTTTTTTITIISVWAAQLPIIVLEMGLL